MKNKVFKRSAGTHVVVQCALLDNEDVSPLLQPRRLPLIYTRAYIIVIYAYGDPVTLPINRKPYYIILLCVRAHTHTHV